MVINPNNEFKQTEIGSIPNDWNVKPLTELIVHIVDNRGRSAPTNEIGIPLIATNCIKEDRLYPAKERIRFVSESAYKTWFRDHPKPGDIIIVNKGTPGLVSFVPDPVDFCMAQDMVALRSNPEKIYNRYLFAFLRSKNFKHQVDSLNVGTTIPHLKKSVFSELYIPIPLRNEQIFIGNIHFSLLKKVEIIRYTNRILNNIGKALFKHWFLDFQFPDKGGNQYRSNSGEMVESIIGDIPKGWNVASLYDIAHFINGKAFKTKDFDSDGCGLPIIKISELKNGITDQTKFSSDKHEDKYRIENGEILFSWSGSPKTSLDTFIWSKGVGWLNQHIFRVIPKNNALKYFIYYAMRLKRREFVQIARNRQTTGLGHVTLADLKRIKMAIPEEKIVNSFNAIIRPVFERTYENLVEDNHLSLLKNTLLPKLISGKIRVTVSEVPQ